ncbi:MAG: phosphopantothenoylcysteine decarboxylase [Endomicrobiia bacterium]
MNKKTVLITAGPTREYLDPVRFISNASSGKLGFTIAKVFQKKFNVILVYGPTNLLPPKNVKSISIETAQEMFSVVKKFFYKSDIFISTAAVADYKPVKVFNQKIKKNSKQYSLLLKPTVDILYYCGKHKNKNQILIGFALETDNKIKNATEKLINKNLDLIVLNSIQSLNSNFITPTIIDKNLKIIKLKKMTKVSFAKKLLNILG